MTEDNIMLDWMDENITIEYEDGKYYLNFHHRDHETGGWDIIRSDEHRTMLDALKSAVEWVEAEAENDRKFAEEYDEYLRWSREHEGDE